MPKRETMALHDGGCSSMHSKRLLNDGRAPLVGQFDLLLHQDHDENLSTLKHELFLTE